MNNPTKLFILLFLSSFSVSAQFKVSANNRYLETADGKPFFWMGDTAWELFHRLSREEADKYLKTRADQGFTVIQAVALAEFDGLHDPNFYGEIPLEADDPTKPREAYFQHVDYIIDKANQYGLTIGLLPTWGDKVFKATWGAGPEVFNASNAKVYGRWLGNRYKNKKNIIWILGGDRNPRNDSDIAIWRSMAEGVVEGVGGQDKAMMTFHPQPNGEKDGGSAKWFHQDTWLDFNMFQTGHCRETNVWDRIKYTYDLKPTKPVLDGEPIYEDHPVCFNAKEFGTSSAYDVRKSAWFSVLAGAFGHTYGCHDIWQMYAPHRTPVNGPHLPWYVAIDLPAANQMKYMKALMTARPIIDRIPDQTLLSTEGGNNDHLQAARGKDYIIVYTSQGKKFTLYTGKIAAKEINVTWYNPKNGENKPVGKMENKTSIEFTPPANGYGQDWVLVVDEVGKDYKIPEFK